MKESLRLRLDQLWSSKRHQDNSTAPLNEDEISKQWEYNVENPSDPKAE